MLTTGKKKQLQYSVLTFFVIIRTGYTDMDDFEIVGGNPFVRNLWPVAMAAVLEPLPKACIYVLGAWAVPPFRRRAISGNFVTLHLNVSIAFVGTPSFTVYNGRNLSNNSTPFMEIPL